MRVPDLRVPDLRVQGLRVLESRLEGSRLKGSSLSCQLIANGVSRWRELTQDGDDSSLSAATRLENPLTSNS